MILVDTNVILDLITGDPKWLDWSVSQLEAAALRSPLAINPVVYAEPAVRYESCEALEALVTGLGLRMLDLPRSALFLAGIAYGQY